MADVPAEMARAGQEFAAAEHQDAKRVDAAVQAMAADAQEGAQPGAGATPAAGAAAGLGIPPEAAQKLCGVAWGILDRLICGFAGKELALTPDELQQLATLTVPVVDKHVPELLKKLMGTPEGVLLLSAGMIYASKAPAVLGMGAGSSSPETPAAPEAQA